MMAWEKGSHGKFQKMAPQRHGAERSKASKASKPAVPFTARGTKCRPHPVGRLPGSEKPSTKEQRRSHLVGAGLSSNPKPKTKDSEHKSTYVNVPTFLGLLYGGSVYRLEVYSSTRWV